MSGPLAGIRLLEMDAIGPVPLAGMILADFGADVIRIARAGGGAWGDLGAKILHRGRTTVTLDVKDPVQRDALLDLIASSDGLIEGSRPGAMEKLGLGPDTCLARNPALVYARVTGWGQEGTLAPLAGHDLTYLAMTGALHAIGPSEGPPVVPLNLVGDYAGGTMFAALGIVAALLAAARDRTGQVIDVAMVDGAAVLMSLFHEMIAAGAWVDRREANLLDGGRPFYRCYACADGRHVAVGALESGFFALLLDGLGIPRDRYRQNDPQDWPAMTADFAQIFASAPRDLWAARFAGTDACVAPVLSIEEASGHPVNRARGMFVDREGVVQAAPAPRFARTPAGIQPDRSATIAEAITSWRR